MDTIRCTIAFVRRINYNFNYVTYITITKKEPRLKSIILLNPQESSK